MFEVPQAKRVRRSKLFDQFSSSAASSDYEDDTQESSAKTRQNENTHNLDIAKPDEGMAVHHYSSDEEMKINYGFEHEYVDIVAPSKSTSTTLPQPLSRDENFLQTQTSDSEADGDTDTEGETDTETEATDKIQHEPRHEDSREQTFDFQLFKPTPSKAPQSLQPQDPSISASNSTNILTQSPQVRTNRITIRSPTPESQTPATGSILRPRPLTHYFTSLFPKYHQILLKTQYAEAATSSSDIEHLSQAKWPGTALPWRILHIQSTKQHATSTVDRASLNHQMTGRRRPSKKRRIVLRQRKQIRLEKASEMVRNEKAEREKRTRRNREKKVKRKAREKAKKVLLQSGESAETGDAVGSGVP